ncbi:cysteine synthase A [Zymomonas mobilis]|uniref:Cysteine synthase n=1 Tax=Zymomonas mobilis subsp. mobilis (strain ATCC 10988 / DSM 424 / LMG 404 / NCIMB 8938 / NRRL B-806 / ZM1) TaxID=555217 RepID=A0A0H3G113_ZYMMA|nr:cysteine synthase A [Zymomonas mobilis]AEH62383.1 cysteine synthase [Zymomonas mobilis subsp. mobilis ATCC 10988]AHB09866.1 cysteine synthase [Zymomonas mobilis subsp. mobilis str. CP4 = NRRL B-14023]AHJ70171.1 cysteine synthase B [Zymomonas mobilis subsp. mobilis NRRL B-12526]AHJ72026.1 cysteine synthase B [Zymomonas mobilis subsp. mobilis str. CP4 = NRRL B-14023]ART93025.1 cysteine synthase A [Zymomonas mobilis subsp. mobilis]
MAKINTILEAIGNTPHLRLNKLFPDHEVWIKVEKSNPGGSIKDRIALAMIEDAEKSGKLKKGGVIIEPTSGNTGIGLAMVAAVKGYKLILVMPESMSIERRRLMLAYGAEFDLTPKEKGMAGAIERARQLAEETEGAWIPQQFENPANINIHATTTGQEILKDFADTPIDALVSGVGTGGHLTGIGESLRKKWPDIQIFAVEPATSPVLAGGKPGAHAIQGIGAGFVPKNLHRNILNGIVEIENDEAKKWALRAAKEEGLLVGISTGATLAAIAKKIKELPANSRILGVNYDTGERYLSVPDFLPEA